MLGRDNKVKVREKATQEVLYECSFDSLENAYEFAAEMESHGIEVVVDTPTAAGSLAHSLGLNSEQREELADSMRQEIEDHDHGCCAREEENKPDSAPEA